MSETPANTLQYRSDGPEDAPVLVLGPALGTTWHMWDRQIPELTRHWRVLRFDLPGHGGAPAEPAPAVGELTDRLLATLDGLGVDRFGYAGCSIGGAMGADLALRHPHRLAALALIAASARSGTADSWHQRGNTVRTSGMDPIARSAPESWFTPNFAGAQPAIVDWAVQMVSTTDPGCYVAACDALAAFDVRAELGRIGVPALVLVGAEDQVTPPADARVLVAGIHDARLAVVPGASHLAPVEAPAAVTDLLVRHFTTAWQLSTQQGLTPVTSPTPPSRTATPAQGPTPGQAFGPAPGSETGQPTGHAPGFPGHGPDAGVASEAFGHMPGRTTGPGGLPPGPAPAPQPGQPAGRAPGFPANDPGVAPGQAPGSGQAPGFAVPGRAEGRTAGQMPGATADHAVGRAPGPGHVAGAAPGHLPGPASGYGFPPAQQPTPAPGGGAPVPPMTGGFGPPPTLEPEAAAATAPDPDPYGRGMRIRREVLGDAHVDAAEAAKDDLTGDYEDFVTRYAWGGAWDRPGLDRRTRALITLTALTAGGHLDDLALHTRAALRCGLTPDDIKEALLHTAVYCGVPAAGAAFQVARRVIAEESAPPA
ncbi:alpha/beta fold hydrolase [Streptomyces olivoreticuli]